MEKKVFRICILSVLGFGIFISLGVGAGARTDTEKPLPVRWRAGFESILPGESHAFLEFIAADELEGRDTASVGQAIARNYIKSLYKVWGIQPAGDIRGSYRSFEQHIDVVEKTFGPDMCLDILEGATRSRFFFEQDFSGNLGVDVPGVIEAPAVFAGYGISAPDLGYDDYSDLDVKGKVVVISTGKPGGGREDSPFNQPENLARFAGRRTPAENCARLLAGKGAAALLLIDDSFGRTGNVGGYIQGNRIRSGSKRLAFLKLSAADPMVPFFWASPQVAEALFAGSALSFSEARAKIDAGLKPHSFVIPGAAVKINMDIRQRRSKTANLLGKIEGSDPELKHEYVVIGAHLDHVGMNDSGYVFNGADDNGSGSVGVMQAAKAFALNPEKPRRSILFAHWTGEEKGLLGSGHFVHFPTVPLEDIAACINMDMICTDTDMANIKRGLEEYSITPEELARFQDNPKTLLAAITSLSSPDMVDCYTEISRDYLNLQPVPLCSDPMPGNSDHWHFSRRNIPSVFFFTMGNGHAHQPTDTVEKINAEKMSEIVKLAYLMAFKIADAPGRPVWVE
jgi:hypothetical protein